jgi:hypothetical protein
MLKESGGFKKLENSLSKVNKFKNAALATILEKKENGWLKIEKV